MCRWKNLPELQQAWIGFLISGFLVFVLIMAIADDIRGRAVDILPISMDCNFKARGDTHQKGDLSCQIDHKKEMMNVMPDISVPIDKLFKLDVLLILVLWPLVLIFNKSTQKLINHYVYK